MSELTRAVFAAAIAVVLFGGSNCEDAGVRSVAIAPIPAPEGASSRAYASSIVELAPYGYVETEFVVSGIASRLAPRPGSAPTPDGHWEVVPRDPTPYSTRILVRRPPAERFNGTVIVEFMQEYFGSERDTNFRWNAETLLAEGFAWVGASLHHESIDVRGRAKVSYAGFEIETGPSLAEWNPERYGKLTYPTSDLCYDALSQIARAVGPSRDRSEIDPLDGLEVARVIGVGNTIAAARLRVYIDTLQPIHRVFDGFFLQDLTDVKVPLSEGVELPEKLQVRDDANVPVIVLNTTTAVADATPQPEADNIRVWEPAGSSHTTGPYMALTALGTKRDMGVDSPICPPERANTLPLQNVSGAAIVALHHWAASGTKAPRFARIDRSGSAEDGGIAFDELGNVAGGLRTPWVDVPIARYDWRGDCMGGAGRTYPFEPEKLTELYGTPETYRRRFADAARNAVATGALLLRDADLAIERANAVDW